MIRVAAFQGIPKSKIEERIPQIVGILAEADRQQIDFLCFPEGFLTGYFAEKELACQTAVAMTDPFFQDFLQQTSPFRPPLL